DSPGCSVTGTQVLRNSATIALRLQRVRRRITSRATSASRPMGAGVTDPPPMRHPQPDSVLPAPLEPPLAPPEPPDAPPAPPDAPPLPLVPPTQTPLVHVAP